MDTELKKESYQVESQFVGCCKSGEQGFQLTNINVISP